MRITISNAQKILILISLISRYRLRNQAKNGLFQAGSKYFLFLRTPYTMCSNFLIRATKAHNGFLPADMSLFFVAFFW